MFSSPIDPQISGVRNNGTPHGITDVNIQSGPLVMVPWRESNFSMSANGAFVEGGANGADNGDGSNSYIEFHPNTTVPAAIPNYIRWQFRGTSLAIRYDPLYTSGGGGLFDFGVHIDRVAYRVSKSLYYSDSLLAWDVQQEITAVITRDLPDTLHEAEIHIAPNVSTNGQRIFGFSADAKYYRPMPPRAYLGTPTALTASFVTVTLQSVNRLRGLGLRGIIYCNLDSVQRVVTVQFLGSTIWTKTLAIGESATFDPLTLVGINSASGSVIGEFKHKVDAITTTAVQSTIIAGM